MTEVSTNSQAMASATGTLVSNLIFGAAVGYELDRIRPFLASLLRTGYKGSIVLMVHEQLARSIEKSEFAERVNCYVVPQWIPFRFKLHRGRRKLLLNLWLPLRWFLWCVLRLVRRFTDDPQNVGSFSLYLLNTLLAPTETRYVHAMKLIKGANFQRVVLTDVRDVYFQADPFENLPKSGLAVGIENVPAQLSHQVLNAKWITTAYDPDMLKKIGHNPISCSGVTYGDRQAIIDYLEAMTHEVLNLKFRATKAPLDQALHNKILWTGEIREFQELRTGDSALATLSNIEIVKPLKSDNAGNLLDRKGRLISILHMYDRWSDIKESKLRALY